MTLDLKELNSADTAKFVHLTEYLVENSPWVLNKIADMRPFSSSDELCQAIEAEIRAAHAKDQVRLFCAHPELAGAEAEAGTMTRESAGEQGRLGLTSLSPAEHDRLKQLNSKYRDQFGFPFIIALARQPDRSAVFSVFEQRVNNAMDQEIDTTIDEIMHVVRGRAARITCESAAIKQQTDTTPTTTP